MALPPKLRRAALETLGRDTLVGLADRFEVEVADRRSKDAAVDALNRSRKLDFGALLAGLTGVDIYDPTTGETAHDDGENVAAWFLDHDYDDRTFCVCQAFFPGGKAKNPWEKLQKALKGSIDEEKFESLRGTRSIPFKPGKKVAVKVIDDRGNEVVGV